jgi:hypothetical protein
MFYIVEKISLVSPGVFLRENIGYIKHDTDNIRMIFESQIAAMHWISANINALESGEKNITDYLAEFGTIYGTPTMTTTIEGMGLPEVTDVIALLGGE